RYVHRPSSNAAWTGGPTYLAASSCTPTSAPRLVRTLGPEWWAAAAPVPAEAVAVGGLVQQLLALAFAVGLADDPAVPAVVGNGEVDDEGHEQILNAGRCRFQRSVKIPDAPVAAARHVPLNSARASGITAPTLPARARLSRCRGTR